jgi:GT2 family glycosyltransferase
MNNQPTLSIGFATINRPRVAQRLIRSVRRFFPDLPIYVADQSLDREPMQAFYDAYDVHLIQMPFDIGVTASRNALVEAMTEDYFVLCDDDFLMGPATSFADAIRILEADPAVGVVGGRLFDFDGSTEHLRNWEIYLQYDPDQRILFSIPIYHLSPRRHDLGSISYFSCDAVLNFAVFRRSIFSEVVRWDERFKSNGEHEDFYLNLKQQASIGVVHLPTMLAYHHHPEDHRVYISRLRDRKEGWRAFFEKWGLEQHIEYGLGVRTIENIGEVMRTDPRQRFFINPALSLHRTEPLPGGLMVRGRQAPTPVGALLPDGATAERAATTGVLKIDPESRRIVPAVAASPPPDVRSDPFERYEDILADQRPVVSATNRPIQFRYDAVLRPDRDFFVWYAATPTAEAADEGVPILAVTVRWTASDGSTLVWRGPRLHLDLTPSAYWRPLLVDPPLLPAGRQWLRFDMVTDGGPSARAVCSGFLMDTGQSEAVEAFAFSRLPGDGAMAGQPGRFLSDVAQVADRSATAVATSASSEVMSLLSIDPDAGLEALYFTDWDCLGRRLVSTRLPGAVPAAPLQLATPGRPWRGEKSAIFGYGKARGFVLLDVEWRDDLASR